MFWRVLHRSCGKRLILRLIFLYEPCKWIVVYEIFQWYYAPCCDHNHNIWPIICNEVNNMLIWKIRSFKDVSSEKFFFIAPQKEHYAWPIQWTHWCVPMDLFDDASLAEVMACYCQGISHYPKQFWQRSLTPCVVAKSQCVQQMCKYHSNINGNACLFNTCHCDKFELTLQICHNGPKLGQIWALSEVCPGHWEHLKKCFMTF